MRQAAAGDGYRSCGHRRPRDKEGTPPQPHLTRAEHGKPVRVRAADWRGRPTVRGAPGRERMPGKPMPAAERQQESGACRIGSFADRPV